MGNSEERRKAAREGRKAKERGHPLSQRSIGPFRARGRKVARRRRWSGVLVSLNLDLGGRGKDAILCTHFSLGLICGTGGGGGVQDWNVVRIRAFALAQAGRALAPWLRCPRSRAAHQKVCARFESLPCHQLALGPDPQNADTNNKVDLAVLEGC